MKKLFALLLASVMLITLAACSDSGKSGESDPVTENSSTEPSQSEKQTESTTEESTTEQQGDDAVVKELKNRLCGDWRFPAEGVEMEHLKFNADGTGTYKGLEDRNYTFTYVVHLDHRTYGNGEPYVENMLKMTYDNGETEDIIFFFNDNGQMAFHNSEDGGYTGVMYSLDLFTKE